MLDHTSKYLRGRSLFVLAAAWIIASLGLTLFSIFPSSSDRLLSWDARVQRLQGELHIESVQHPEFWRLSRDSQLLAWRERIEPQSWLPRSFDFDFEELQRLVRYERECWQAHPPEPSTPSLHKYWSWAKALCDQIVLPVAFFQAAPFVHPLGLSYVARAEKLNLPVTTRPEWARETSSFRHLGDVEPSAQYPNGEIPWDRLQGIHARALRELFSAQPVVVDHTYTFVSTDPERPGGEYRVIDSALFLEGMKKRGFALAESPDENCLSQQGSACWVPTQGINRSMAIVLVVGFWVLSSIVLFLIILAQRKERGKIERDRMMALHTLAHEVRTPVAGIVLSTELMRESFDQLPEKGQDAYLRLCDDTLRLQRVITSSVQYLRADGMERKINVTLRMDLFEEIQRLVERYHERIELDLDTSLAHSFATDYFWLEICVKNLIENALRHGKEPVRVHAQYRQEFLEIAVTDAGTSSEISLAHIIKPFVRRRDGQGTGLGLSIVHQVCKQLGGRLTYRGPPTCFTIFIANQEQQKP